MIKFTVVTVLIVVQLFCSINAHASNEQSVDNLDSADNLAQDASADGAIDSAAPGVNQKSGQNANTNVNVSPSTKFINAGSAPSFNGVDNKANVFVAPKQKQKQWSSPVAIKTSGARAIQPPSEQQAQVFEPQDASANGVIDSAATGVNQNGAQEAINNVEANPKTKLVNSGSGPTLNIIENKPTIVVAPKQDAKQSSSPVAVNSKGRSLGEGGDVNFDEIFQDPAATAAGAASATTTGVQNANTKANAGASTNIVNAAPSINVVEQKPTNIVSTDQNQVQQASPSSSQNLNILNPLANLLKTGSAPLSAANLNGKPGIGARTATGAAPSEVAREVLAKEIVKLEEKTTTELDFFSIKGLTNWSKLLFNPFELVKALAATFKLDLAVLVDQIGASAIWGIEAAFSPVLAGIKILEKVLVPNSCKLKFMCDLGTKVGFMRDTMLKFTPAFIGGSLNLRAFTDGVIGRNCVEAFPLCTPDLKKPFEGLKVLGI